MRFKGYQLYFKFKLTSPLQKYIMMIYSAKFALCKSNKFVLMFLEIWCPACHKLDKIGEIRAKFEYFQLHSVSHFIHELALTLKTIYFINHVSSHNRLTKVQDINHGIFVPTVESKRGIIHKDLGWTLSKYS